MQWLIRTLKTLRTGFGRVLRSAGRFLSFRRSLFASSILAMLFLSFVYGGASIYFNLSAAPHLKRAFMGFDAWHRHGASSQQFMGKPGETRLGVTCDDPSKTFDGFTLYTTTRDASALLLDMRGTVAHRWYKPFSQVWPHPTQVKNVVADDLIHWFRCRLFPNGDLLAVYQTDADTPHGYGLAKLDKDSNLLWEYSGNVHHDVEVGDDGRIYALTHQISTEEVSGFTHISTPYVADYLVVLSPDGKELKKISILGALQNTPFSLLLTSISAGGLQPPSARPPPKTPASEMQAAMMLPTMENGDVLHVNSIRVLNRAQATRFPQFKAGQVLLSLCYLNAIAVLDLPTRSIVWAAQGAWRFQHDAEFLDNGHLLVYDNVGLKNNTRVLEFDPVTQGYPWSYSNENSIMFAARHRGTKQRLPNCNVLIVDPDAGRIFEVTAAKALAWEYGCPVQSDIPDAHAIVTGAWRYSSAELKFLDGIRPR